MSHTHTTLPAGVLRTLIAGTLMVAAVFVVRPCGAALPYEETFEAGYTNNQPVDGVFDAESTWTASSGVKIQDSDTYAGTYGVYIPAEEGATNSFATNPTKVWIDMLVKPSRQSAYATGNPDYDADAAAFFFFNSNGYAVVRNGGASGSWDIKSHAIDGDGPFTCTVNQTSYDRITVFQNYETGKWALYLNDICMAEQLNFINPALSAFDKFALRNGTYLDNLWVDDYFPTASTGLNGELTGTGVGGNPDQDMDGSHDVFEQHYFDTASAYGSSRDPDGDGKTNEEEWMNGTDPSEVGSSAWGIPYFQMFEVPVASLAGTWRGLTAAGDVSIVASADLQGSRILALSTGSVAFSAAYLDTQTSGQNVWVQMYAKPGVYYTGGGFPEPDTDTVACFIVQRGTGALYMYSGNGWTPGNGTIVPTNTWLGFAVHLDYSARQWDLFVTTNTAAMGDTAYGAMMQRANGSPLNFHADATATEFSGFEIDTELPAYVDAVAVSPAYTNCQSIDTNLVVQDRIADQRNGITLPPKDYDFDEGVTDMLSGMLGRDLSRGLATSTDPNYAAHVYLYDDGNFPSAYQQSTLAWSGSATSTDANNNEGVLIDRRPGADYAVFYPFPAENDEVGAPQVIMGPDDPANPGEYWALLYNSPTAPPVQMVNGSGVPWNLDNPQHRDQVWIYRDGRFINLFYSATLGGWRAGASPSTETLYRSETIWYFRRDGSNGTWIPPQ